MAKYCVVCGKKIGVFEDWKPCRDGVLCDSCWARLSVHAPDVSDVNHEKFIQIRDAVDKNEQIVAHFRESYRVGNKFGYAALFDDSSRMVLLPQKMSISFEKQHFWAFRYDDLMSAELFRNKKSIQVSGAADVVVGGLLFGTVGALAGMAHAQDVRATEASDTIEVVTRVRSYPGGKYTTLLHAGGMQAKGNSIDTLLAYGIEMVDKINEVVMQTAQSNRAAPEMNTSVPIDPAEEIRKFKALADDGIITSEEFEIKKKQLLGL